MCVNISTTIKLTYDFIHHTGPIYMLYMNNLFIPHYWHNTDISEIINNNKNNSNTDPTEVF
jgi:hypothetical protein